LETVSKSLWEQHNRMTDERFGRDIERIKKLEESQEKVADLTLQMAEILKNQNRWLEKLEGRVSGLESRPSRWMDRIQAAAISALISALMAYLSL